MRPACLTLLLLVACGDTPVAPPPAGPTTTVAKQAAPPPIGHTGGVTPRPDQPMPIPTAEDLLLVTPHELVLAEALQASYPRVVEQVDGITVVSTPSHTRKIRVRTPGNLLAETQTRFGDQHSAEEVLPLLGLGPGMRVADIGCGGGRFAFPFARAVGEEGLVWCIDLDATAIRFTRERAVELGITNMQLVHAPFAHTLLEPGSADLAFLSDVHAFLRPDIEEDEHTHASLASFYASIHQGLAPGGRVVIIEATSNGRRVTGEQIVAQVEAWGFRLVQRRDELLPSHHLMLFEPARGD
jgi:SAM-dependent methyltransferase